MPATPPGPIAGASVVVVIGTDLASVTPTTADAPPRRLTASQSGRWTRSPPSAVTPRRPALFLDFDGTLSPIVAVAADARPLPGAVEVLVALAERFAVVAVVSGRPVAFLAGPPARRRRAARALRARGGGRRSTDRPGRGAGVARGRRRGGGSRRWSTVPPGLDVEHKGLSLTLHFRRQPELADAALALGGRRPRSDRGSQLRSGEDVARAPSAGGRRQGHGGRGAGRRACRRWPTSAMTRATSRPSTRSTGWPPEGSRR